MRRLRHALRSAAVVAALASSGLSAAQGCTAESEPNDTPQTATGYAGEGRAVGRGEAERLRCFSGSISSGDQDAFVWTVTAEDAAMLWTLEVTGPRGGLTQADLVAVEFGPGGEGVVSADYLFRHGTTDGVSSASAPFFLPEGRLVVGVSGSGAAGEYVVSLSPTPSRGGRPSGPGHRGPFDVLAPYEEGFSQWFALDSAAEEESFELVLHAALGSGATAVVAGPDGYSATLSATGAEPSRLTGLGLVAGEYSVTVQKAEGARSGFARLTLRSLGKRSAGAEIEPNEGAAQATFVPFDATLTGTAEGNDHFSFAVSESQAGQAWDMTLEAEAELRLRLYGPSGDLLQERRGVAGTSRRLHLAAGVHVLQVGGRGDAAYSIRFAPAASAADGWEREPNDLIAGAHVLDEQMQARGELGLQDVDHFAVVVEGGAQLHRVQVIGSGALDVSVHDAGGGQIARVRGEGRVRLDDLVLLPGRSYVRVAGEGGEYAMRALALGPAPERVATDTVTSPDASIVAAPVPAPAVDLEEPLPPPPPGALERESNDDASRAGRMVPGQVHVGRIGQDGDVDLFRFWLPVDQFVRVELGPPGEEAGWRVDLDGARLATTEAGTPLAVAESWLLAGDHTLQPRQPSGTAAPTGYYQVRVTPLGPLWPGPTADAASADGAGQGVGEAGSGSGPSDVALELELADDVAAAYWHEAQTIRGTLTLRNKGDQDVELELRGVATAFGASVELPARAAVAAGATTSVPVEFQLPSDLPAGPHTLLQVAASPVSRGEAADGPAEAGRAATAALQLRCDAEPVLPTPYWTLPRELLGLPNALAASLGATSAAGSAVVDRDRYLNDGRTSVARAAYLAEDHVPTMRLAGEQPVTLLGSVLNPASDQPASRQLKAFRIETSLDGRTFEPVLEGELSASAADHFFAFERPVEARYARLVFVSSHDGRPGGYLGEWKLLAQDAELLHGHDIAAAELGGHIVFTDPVISLSDIDVIVSGEGTARRLDLRGHDTFRLVLGFASGRAALVERVVIGQQGVGGYESFTQAHVLASSTGAAGPWELVGEVTLAGPDQETVFTPAAPFWARYLRIEMPRPADERYLAAPHGISVFEATGHGGYRSVIGEWGTDERRGPLELGRTDQEEASRSSGTPADAGDTPASATPLTGGRATGTVAVAEDVDWYRITVGAGENYLEVRLGGDPTVRYVHRLTTAAGDDVAFEQGMDGDVVVLRAFVEPGDYLLGLEEPKRTVVFAWDTSGSVSPYVPITYATLASFAAGVDPDREAVQLLAFNDPAPKWLLPSWSSDPELVQRRLNDWDRAADSSNAELALLTAVRGLSEREGTKAVLFITDAETGGWNLSLDLWRELEAVRPQVFTFEVSSGGGARAQQLMQGWAAAGGGVYDMASGVGDLDAGFDRASCLLRRPKRYEVEVTTAFVEPPGPGTLTVTHADGGAAPAVHVVFDASGSMGSRMPSGEQRIEAARAALGDLVSEVLPEGASFSLRAFGHVSPSSCESRLEVEPGPLDRQRAAAAVGAIQPKLLSQTALAEALELASTDLSNSRGPKTVIVISDGVESCGGDPQAAARTLTAAGDVALAFVTLALEGDALDQLQDLAAATGASLVDVTSLEDLSAAVEAALNPPFEVVDAGGTVVATGRVGEAVTLPMGVYVVRVLGASPEEIGGVRVPGDGSVVVAVGAR